MTIEELQKIQNEAWEQFRVNYTTLTDDAWYARVFRAIFGGKGLTRMVWDNGYLKGANTVLDDELVKLRSGSVPPELKSGQPESPESHSSSHSQGGGFPDADPSK